MNVSRRVVAALLRNRRILDMGGSMIFDEHGVINCYKCVHLLHMETETNVTSAGEREREKKAVCVSAPMFFFLFFL